MRPLPLLMTLALVSMAGAAFGAEPAPQTTPVDETAAKAPAKSATEDAAAKDQDKPAAATPDKHGTEASKSGKSAADKSTTEKSSPQRFVPTEQVRADFDVSFPVDM